MELLRAIEKLNNKEPDCPVRLEKGELLQLGNDTTKSFKLTLKALRSDVSAVYIDVACYDQSGNILSIIEGVYCSLGETSIDSPSLMTAYGAVIVRSVMLDDGMWESSEVFPKTIEVFEETKSYDFDKTDRVQKVDFEKTDRLTAVDDKILKADKFISELNEKKSKKTKKKRGWIFIVLFIVVVCMAVVGYKYVKDSNAVYEKAMNLYNSENFEDALKELQNADKFIFIGDKNKEVDWCIAVCYARQRDFINAAAYFKDIPDYRKSKENYRSIMEAYSGILSKGDNHTVGLTESGRITTSGSNDKGQCDVGGFINIIEVSAGGEHTVAINRANRCIARGNNEKGQCDIGKWENIFDISAGKYHTVGVTNLGRAVAAGDNTYGQCNVDNWSGLVSVSAGAYHTVGLTLDGRVVAVGRNKDGECNTSSWTNVVQVAAGDGYTVALTYDGEILRCGNNQNNITDVVSVDSSKGPLMFVTGEGEISKDGLSEIGLPKETVTIFKR